MSFFLFFPRVFFVFILFRTRSPWFSLTIVLVLLHLAFLLEFTSISSYMPLSTHFLYFHNAFARHIPCSTKLISSAQTLYIAPLAPFSPFSTMFWLYSSFLAPSLAIVNLNHFYIRQASKPIYLFHFTHILTAHISQETFFVGIIWFELRFNVTGNLFWFARETGVKSLTSKEIMLGSSMKKMPVE